LYPVQKPEKEKSAQRPKINKYHANRNASVVPPGKDRDAKTLEMQKYVAWMEEGLAMKRVFRF
jgi:hypothetical protein